MSYTKDIGCEADEWTSVAPQGRAVFLQLQGTRPVMVMVSADEPPEAFNGGIVLDRDGLQELSLENPEASDRVWIKCMGSDPDDDSEVCAIISGEDPFAQGGLG